MPSAHPLPPQLARRAFSVDEALPLGVPAHRLRAKDLVAPFHGVRMAADSGSSLVNRCRAYARRAPDAVFSHATAALLWGLPLPRRLESDTRLHVSTIGVARARRGVGVVGHKSGRMPRVVRRGAVTVTDPIDTWIALASVLDVDDLVVAGDRLVGLPAPLATIDAVRARVDALHGERGAKRLRAALLEVRPGSRSPRETRTRRDIVRAGFPEPALNAPIALPGGFTLTGDLVYAQLGILLEYEGDQHRTDDAQWAHDLRRYNELSRAGWIVIRISRHMTSPEVVAALRAAFDARGVSR